jgi:5-methyltetrahydropteroyltriglutamate--homocysteine methyltransferase
LTLDTYDIGSLPLRVEEKAIYDGAKRSGSLLSLVGVSDDSVQTFEEEVVTAFIDKLSAGLTVPNYPQFRDMNDMFFDLLRGIKKTEAGYVALKTVSAIPEATISEVDVIRENSSRIRDIAGIEKTKVKVCVTGPYTLASFFQGKNAKLIRDLGQALSDVVYRTAFSSRYSEVVLVCIDEPVIGFLNDPLLDYGSDGREALRSAWEEICGAASSKGASTSIHLHDTSDDMFWEVKQLDLIQAHIVDPIYVQEATKRRMEETGKRLKASIFATQFDNLITNSLKRKGLKGNLQQHVGDIWTQIGRKRVDPMTFLEGIDVGVKRLSNVVERFGAENVLMAGPECGLGSWPSYETAMECLRRTAEAVKVI